MNKKRLLMLAETLESGKYRQTKGSLRAGNRFCVLGVACEVYRLKTKKGKWLGESFHLGATSSAFVLPTSVVKFFGFATVTGEVASVNFASLNDKGARFKTLAKVLRTVVK